VQKGNIVEFTKKLIEMLKGTLGEKGDYAPDQNLWIENPWCGDTEGGFYSTYEINYDELEKVIDAWIAEQFPQIKE
jgi:hypothetical protein